MREQHLPPEVTAFGVPEASKKNPEKKDKQPNRDLANQAVAELQELAKNQKDTVEFDRLKHTMAAMEYALAKIPNNRPSYRVEMTNAKGKLVAAQQEGVPVDEAIDIMKAEAERLKAEDAEGNKDRIAQLENLASELTNQSQAYFDIHFPIDGKPRGDQPLNSKESDKQHLRTLKEAYLRYKDYRASKNPDPLEAEREDYLGAMKDFEKRRELWLMSETEGVTSSAPELPAQEGPMRLTSVDISSVAEQYARLRAERKLTELLNEQKGWRRFVTKWWYVAAESGYRRKFIEEEKKKIVSEKPSRANLFADLAKQAENDQEIQAILERFNQDHENYIRKTEGEQKIAVEDKKVNGQMQDLIKAYATGKMTDEQFDETKVAILSEFYKDHPEALDQQSFLTVDNFLETARECRKLYEHGQGLARLDAGLLLDLGIAKGALKTDQRLNKIEEYIIDKLEQMPVLGRIITPTTAAFAVSLTNVLMRKPASWLTGPIGLGGLLGAVRRGKQIKTDVAMHRFERALGTKLEDYGPGAERRKNMEKFVYDMRGADDIKTQLFELLSQSKAEGLNAEKTKKLQSKLIKEIVDAEARMSLSEEHKLDLIEYNGETTLQRSRLDLLKSLAEAKVSLKDVDWAKQLEGRKGELTKGKGGIKEIDKKFIWFKSKEMAKAALVGAALGLTIGELTTEAMAWAGLGPGEGKVTMGQKLYEWISGHGPRSPEAMQTISSDAGTTAFKLPDHTQLELSSDGSYNLVDTRSGHVLDHIAYDKQTGTVLGHEAQGVQLNLVNEQQGSMPNLETGHRGIWYVNQYLNKSDHGEYKLWPGGEHNTGFTKEGNLDLDLSHFFTKAGRSWNGHHRPDLSGSRLAVFITPDKAHPSQGFMVDVDPKTHHAIVSGDEPWVKQLCRVNFKDGKFGKFEYDGAYMEAVEKIGENPDGSPTFNILATVVGKNTAGPAVSEDHLYHITLDDTREIQPPLFIPVFPRKELETYKGNDGVDENRPNKQVQEAKKTQGGSDVADKDDIAQKELFKSRKTVKDDDIRKTIDRSIKNRDWERDGVTSRDFVPPEADKKKLAKKGIGVASRGQKAYNDREDLGERYPEVFRFKNSKDIAAYILAHPEIPLLAGDKSIIQMSEEEALEYLTKAVDKEQSLYEQKEKDSDTMRYIQEALSMVDKVFSEHVKDKNHRSVLPDKNKIHLLGYYNYLGQTNGGQKAAGLFFFNSGEIFVNMAYVETLPKNKQKETLQHIFVHELTHATATNSYWRADYKDTSSNRYEHSYMPRRTGLMFVRREKDAEGYRFKPHERGRALNEAATETLAREILSRLSKDRSGPTTMQDVYRGERDILRLLYQKLGVNTDMFLQAAIDRKALPELVRALSGEDKTRRLSKRPEFLPILLSIMDYEFNNGLHRYGMTQKFINGEKVHIHSGVQKYFPAGLHQVLQDANNAYGKRLRKAYPHLKFGKLP